LPQHLKGISGGAIWTLSGFVLVACSGGGGGGTSSGLGGAGSGSSGDLPPAGRAFSLESAAFTGGDGADLVITTANADGNGGHDIIFGSTASQAINGGGGHDAIFGEGGSGDTIGGDAGNDLIVAGVFHTDELDAYRAEQTRFDLQIDFLSPPDDITAGAAIIFGGIGHDLIFVHLKPDPNHPNALHSIRGDTGGQPTADDGNDLIIAHSNSSITGGGGDDIFWLRPEEAGDVFTITDFGTENSDSEAVGDRFLIVVTDSVKTGLGDNPTFDAIRTAAGWGTPTQSNADTEITVSATIGEVEGTYTIRLQSFTATALEADDFLIMTQAETEAFIAAFDDTGANIL
jgi:Ca2+-binding RTX toxin-like protein